MTISKLTLASLLAGLLPLQSHLYAQNNPADYYEEIADSRGLGNVVGYGRGSAFVDIDADGDDDLFVADTDGRLFDAPYGMSQIYLNDGRGQFVPAEFNLNPDDFLGTWAGAFADIDNDGDPDMLVVNGGYTTESSLALLENRIDLGQGLVNITESSRMRNADELQESHSWWGVSWADFDNDGWLDVVVTRRGERPLLFHNQGEGAFAERGLELGLGERDHNDVKNPVWIDFDTDGDQDLYIAGMDWHGFFRNDGGEFVEITDQVFTEVMEGHSGLPAVFAAATADFDQDGNEDIYLGRWDSQDYIYYSDGRGGFERTGREAGIDTANHIKLSDTDVRVMANEAQGLRRRERAQSPDGKEITLAPFENTMGLGVGDLFDDGYPDIVIGTGNPQFVAEDVIFCNQQGRQFQRCTDLFVEEDDSHAMTRGHGVSFADIDRDGFTDFFFNLGGHPPYDFQRNEESRETNKLFVRRTDEQANAAWLTLAGTNSNRDAVGARVAYEVDGRTHYQFIRSTVGFQSQNSKTLLLALGESDSTEVQVRWPSGAEQTAVLSAGEQLLLIEE